MNEDEVKELIDAEVERKFDERLEDISAQLEEKAAYSGFKGGVVVVMVLVVLAGIITLVIEIATRSVIDKRDTAALEESYSNDEWLDVFSANKDSSTVQEITDSTRGIGESYKIIIEKDWSVYAFERDDRYEVYLYKHFKNGKDYVYMAKYDDQPYSYVNFTSESYGEIESKVHNDGIHSHEADEENSRINFVSVGNREFPVSDKQVELLKKYVKLVPAST